MQTNSNPGSPFGIQGKCSPEGPWKILQLLFQGGVQVPELEVHLQSLYESRPSTDELMMQFVGGVSAGGGSRLRLMVRSQRITTVKVSCVKSILYWIHSTLFLISCPTRCLLIKYLILGSLQPPRPVKTMRHIWLSFKSHYKQSSMRSVSAAAVSVSSSVSLLDDQAGDALWRPSAVTHCNLLYLKEGLMKQMLEGKQEARSGDGACETFILFYRMMWMFSWHSYLRKEVNSN